MHERSDKHSPAACRGTWVLATALHDVARSEPALEGAVAWSQTAVIHEARRDRRRRYQRRGQKSLPKRSWYLHFAQRALEIPDRYALRSPDAQRGLKRRARPAGRVRLKVGLGSKLARADRPANEQ